MHLFSTNTDVIIDIVFFGYIGLNILLEVLIYGFKQFNNEKASSICKKLKNILTFAFHKISKVEKVEEEIKK